MLQRMIILTFITTQFNSGKGLNYVLRQSTWLPNPEAFYTEFHIFYLSEMASVLK